MSAIEMSIMQKILLILHNKIGVDGSALSPEYWDKPITGEPCYLSGVLLAYLFFEIEKEFDVCIYHSCLSPYTFNTIRNMAKAVIICKG